MTYRATKLYTRVFPIKESQDKRKYPNWEINLIQKIKAAFDIVQKQ